MISVIIPCYRCGDTIQRALDSVLAQTLQPTEILLIDDASSDKTLDLLHGFEILYRPLVKVLALKQNMGPGVARNSGWDAATQPWLAFLDADDAWHPRKLEIQWGWLQAHPEVVLCGHSTQLDFEKMITSPIHDNPPAKLLTFLNMLLSNQLPTRTVMVLRSLPNRFSKRYFSEDYHLWLEIIQDGHFVSRLEAPLACSFRPDFSPGGLSGQLWRHEKNELGVFLDLWRKEKMNIATLLLATVWSMLKFLRRLRVVVTST